ncbi:AAA family ATPase (plasmid) [Bacillus cereus]|uniref:AAA+ ATPase domain-containing protein n=1 Tax=Bacillus thuringiensis serovar kumamotoensis TaxID=132267 RepID=A0A9X6JH56_BACUK|nr:AAA family ATPase [Bacillus thuringiensis]MDA2252504.1 AAA family ATPase [Bacillus cereus]MDA2280294.1 AAA family ATPase [Bacillus cereus]MDA2693827.1 AAA family ATPase [Bacillus cereus]MDA2699423.1 AAA family ATPase [Bacillus cereus]MDA2721783.1 AAA family ATPase [Bacillus cereus]
MTDIFVTELNINKVRHLKNVSIPLSKETRKHLILTGKNGSGKTSLLEGILQYLEISENSSITQLSRNHEYIAVHKNALNNLKIELQNNPNDSELLMRIEEQERYIQNNRDNIEKYEGKVKLSFNTLLNIDKYYENGKYIISYFNANRNSQMDIPNGIEKTQLTPTKQIKTNANSIFLKYLVDLKAQQMFAQQAGDLHISKDIEKWFNNLERCFQMIFENNELVLKFDYVNYNFIIEEPGKEAYTLNTLSSGYSSLLHIITELIIRMLSANAPLYDIQGIVLIDEIDVHLHISLQKKVLKLLTDLFPNIQFIISTHSPFVINSIENAVVYDLEKDLLVNDLALFPFQAILEGYFEIDQYSYLFKEKLQEYQRLSENVNGLSEEEMLKLEKLREDFSTVPKENTKELQLKLAEIDLQMILSGENNDIN